MLLDKKYRDQEPVRNVRGFAFRAGAISRVPGYNPALASPEVCGQVRYTSSIKDNTEVNVVPVQWHRDDEAT
jgi:hypothetical protein